MTKGYTPGRSQLAFPTPCLIYKEFLILKKSSVHGFDERNTQESKRVPRLRQLQHLSAPRQKTSQPQEEQSPHFVLRSSRESAKNLHFSLV